MTRHYTLHTPAAGIRVAVTTVTTIVLDPGPDDRARRRNLARERLLTAGTVILTLVSVGLLRTSEPHNEPWTLAAGLLLGALTCHAARPAHRTVPAELVKLLSPLRTTVPACPGQIHRLVWEASHLVAAAACQDTPSCPDCGCNLDQIRARLRALVAATPPRSPGSPPEAG